MIMREREDEKHSIKESNRHFLATLFIILNYSPIVQDIVRFPAKLQILKVNLVLNFSLPLQARVINKNDVNVLKFNGDSLKDHKRYDIANLCPLSL